MTHNNSHEPLRALADMRNEDGEAVRWDLESLTTDLTLKIVEQLAETPAYHLLATLIPPDKVALYFEKLVRHEIYPVLRTAYVPHWPTSRLVYGSAQGVAWMGHGGLGPILHTHWPFPNMPLKLGASWSVYRSVRSTLSSLYKRLRRWLRLPRLAPPSGAFSRSRANPSPTIAVHYIEGVDLDRRSELFWHPASGIAPDRILVFFDSVPSTNQGKWISESTLTRIEQSGMTWVALEEGVVARQDAPVWRTNSRRDGLQAEFNRRKREPNGIADRWVYKASEQLLTLVDYWMDFYREFNCMIHIGMEAAVSGNVAQNIALDLTGGLRVGWKRSESIMTGGNELGHHPYHVGFTWNVRGVSDFQRNRNRNQSIVISGYPYEVARKSREESLESFESRAYLAGHGVGFVVALFDNSFFPAGMFSKEMMAGMYTAFLHWVLEDGQVGVLTKTKRPSILQGLPEIDELMHQAQATGRWINLSNPGGRLPSDASHEADVSVGIGISSAVTEAVVAGGRGVHCDLTRMHAQPFYKWGYEKVVFDDLDRMMAALKRYKDDPNSEPGLGDFSEHMDQVDPYHDGAGHQRIGTYLRFLLDSFDAGADRVVAVRQANEQFRSRWGEDKVVEITTAPVEAVR